jgi:hypothetical protein
MQACMAATRSYDACVVQALAQSVARESLSDVPNQWPKKSSACAAMKRPTVSPPPSCCGAHMDGGRGGLGSVAYRYGVQHQSVRRWALLRLPEGETRSQIRVCVLDRALSKRVLSLTATTNGCASSCAALGRCFGSLISARRTKSFSSLLPSGTLGGGSCSTWRVQTHAHIYRWARDAPATPCAAPEKDTPAQCVAVGGVCG